MRSRLAFLSLALIFIPAVNASPQSVPNPNSNPNAPASAQSLPADKAAPAAEAAASAPADTRQITIPAGTEVLLQLKNAIDTKSARVGDGVYCQTSFPIVIDNVIVIPPGSFVKGEISKVQRAGRLSGRAEILFHFDSVIFPSGYTVDMPGSLHGDSGSQNSKVADEEGTVKTDSHDKLKKLPDVGRDAGYGAIGGTIATGSLNGARIGGGIGAVAGLATMMLSRGSDVRIEPGAALTMRLQRPLVVDITASSAHSDAQVIPRQTNTRLPVPGASSKQQ
jgi:type IV secretion system protein VirB10